MLRRCQYLHRLHNLWNACHRTRLHIYLYRSDGLLFESIETSNCFSKSSHKYLLTARIKVLQITSYLSANFPLLKLLLFPLYSRLTFLVFLSSFIGFSEFLLKWSRASSRSDKVASFLRPALKLFKLWLEWSAEDICILDKEWLMSTLIALLSIWFETWTIFTLSIFSVTINSSLLFDSKI